MATDTYFTIAAPSDGLYKEKASKFLAFAFPVRTEDEVRERLAALRKQFFDARHHCYAYCLGRHGATFRANDDGEPGNSAGQPILGQIRAKNLTDVLVVVVRYFGGTKLGVGGLMQAYKTATAEALSCAYIEERHYAQTIAVHFPYENMNGIMKVAKDFELPIISQHFDMQCEMAFDVRESLLAQVLARLEDWGAVKA